MAFCSDHFWCAIQIAVLAFLRVEGKRSDVYFGEEDGDSTLKLNLHEFNCFFLQCAPLALFTLQMLAILHTEK